jgi:hypothetical protein
MLKHRLVIERKTKNHFIILINMALQLEINNRSLRGSDTISRVEYFSVYVDQFKWKRDIDDNFTFYNSTQTVNAYGAENLNVLGVTQNKFTGEQEGAAAFVYTDTINPDTGVVFTSADVFATWLGANTGFFFNPNPATITVNGIDELIANDGQNIIVSLQSLIDEQIKTNKLLSKIYNHE